MRFRLSFCIPTYNRAAFIGHALESIISQATTDVEIVISDNASTDNTGEVVAKYKKIFPNISYFCWEKNMGPDKNYLKVVELARGEFCWLLGSDDTIRDGAIRYVLSQTLLKYDVYIVNRAECNFSMQFLGNRLWLSPEVSTRIFDFSDKKQVLEYFKNSKSLGAVFSYLSSIIFKKSRWDIIPYDTSYNGTAYSHVYKILSLLRSGGILKYCSEICVNNRNGNDSFKVDGDLRRFLIDIDGYYKLGLDIFDDDEEMQKYFYLIMHKEHPYYRVFKMICLLNEEHFPTTREMLMKMGYDKRMLDLFFILRMSKPIVVRLNKIKRLFN